MIPLDGFQDQYGCIVQADGDGGDSPQRSSAVYGMRAILGEDTSDWQKVAQNYEPNLDGIFRRHPVRWNDPADFSRDQMCMVIFACALLQDKARASRIRQAFAQRLWLNQNKDLPSPGQIAGLIRACQSKALYPLLFLLDLLMFADLYFRKRQLWDYDNMLFMQMATAQQVMPTAAAKLAWTQYMKTDWRERVRYYHETTAIINGCDPVYKYYRAVADKIESERV